MYRFLALVFVFAAAACGGGDPPANSPFGKSTATTGPTEAVLGVKEQPSATTTAQPTPPGSYVVVEGDTLSEIAAKFNTDTATLVAANNLADADALFVGQELKIAAAGSVTATPAASLTSTPTQ
ncbi:MAG: LysM peptidoglycan-binding domain-containing protein [bacterium]